MKYRLFVPSLLLLAAVLACGPAAANTPSPGLVQTAIVQTQAAGATAQMATLNASLPSPTWTPLTVRTKPPTSAPAAPPTDTPAPSDTPHRVATAAPAVTPTPTPSTTPTRRPAPAGPSFLDTVVAVRKQVENFGWQIDQAASSGKFDCQPAVTAYEYVAAHATIQNVPASLAGAYGLYTQGVTTFTTKAADLYTNCKNYLANPSGGGSIPPLQWTVARTSVTDADQLLRQAIIAAGGTP